VRAARAIAVVLSLASLLAVAEPRAGYVVIVHPSIPVQGVERKLLSDLFLKKVTRWPHGGSIRPVDQKVEAGVRRKFSEDVFGRSSSAIRTAWQQAIFSGRDVPPPELETGEAVVDFVLRNPGAVGYVSPETPLKGARVIPVRW